MNNRKKIYNIALAALIAAFYAVLTFISAVFGLSGGVVQLRLSEALCVLPFFTPAAVPGLFIGCVLSNILTGCALWDVVLGSLATLIGALGTYFIGKKSKKIILSLVAPVISNTLIIPLVLAFVYSSQGALPFFFITVFAGEALSCGVLGGLLGRALKKTKFFAQKN